MAARPLLTSCIHRNNKRGRVRGRALAAVWQLEATGGAPVSNLQGVVPQQPPGESLTTSQGVSDLTAEAATPEAAINV